MRNAALAALLLLLAACSTPELPADRFYRLELPPPSAVLPVARLPGALSVNRFSTDGPIGDRPILFAERATPFQLQQYHYSYWAEAPGAMLAAALAGYLRDANLAETVLFADLRSPSAYAVNGRVTRFERLTGGERPAAVVAMELSLDRTNDGRAILRRSYEVAEPAAGGDMTATVLAFRRAVAAIYARFLEEVAAL